MLESIKIGVKNKDYPQQGQPLWQYFSFDFCHYFRNKMETGTEALDILENKIQQLELKVYGDSIYCPENSIIDSLLQANTLMSAALSGKEKFASVNKRLYEMNDYLELNPLSEELSGLTRKMNIIQSMKDELESNIEKIEKINELKDVLDNDKIKNTQLLKDDLTKLLAKHLTTKEKLHKINTSVNNILTSFNEICIEISKSFFLLNESVTKLESSKA
ncbi:hypothetical protein RUM44_004134 [Polyplax serrata]|uniref:Uncharacterized protein n=1 Tax=Polyplax serrata TaxID=468196 RepID=A0ABR1B1Z5_POLSC